MDITYTIIGTDGRQYGPATEDQIRDWIREKRVLPETKVFRSDTQFWMDAWQYVELGIARTTAQPAPATPTRPAVQVRIRQQPGK